MKTKTDWRDLISGATYLAVFAVVVSTVIGVPFPWALAGLAAWVAYYFYKQLQ